MAWRKHPRPEINAGSMADIAFLLLIFFLVTTTMDVDGGIQRKLPPIQDSPTPPDKPVRQRNLFSVLINTRGKLMVEDQETPVQNLREAAILFLDNNGDGSCSYCQGSQAGNLSENPQKAVISIQNDRDTPYRLYVAVQNELTAAYNELREREAVNQYGRGYNQLFKTEQAEIQKLYPQKISEAEPVDFNY